MQVSLAEVRAGDGVTIDGNIGGEVVFVSVAASYATDYLAEDWPLEQYDGIMIRQSNGALIFHPRSLFDAGDLNIILHKS